MKRGIEGPLVDFKDIIGDLLDALGYGPTVRRCQTDRLEYEQIQRTLHKIGRLSHRDPTPKLLTGQDSPSPQ
jgi:hypothetical protein